MNKAAIQAKEVESSFLAGVQAVLAHLDELGVEEVRELDAPEEGGAFKLPPLTPLANPEHHGSQA